MTATHLTVKFDGTLRPSLHAKVSYGSNKLRCEELLCAAADDPAMRFPYTALRLPDVYGPVPVPFCVVVTSPQANG